MQSASVRYGLPAYPLSASSVLFDLVNAQYDIIIDAEALVKEKIHRECQHEFER